jgi:hypothetical protein
MALATSNDCNITRQRLQHRKVTIATSENLQSTHFAPGGERRPARLTLAGVSGGALVLGPWP